MKRRKNPGLEKCYSISKVAEILSVSRLTVYKWLAIEDPDSAVISPFDWFRLPVSGHIRIKEKALFKLIQDLHLDV